MNVEIAKTSYESCDNHFSICTIGLMRGSRHSVQPAMLDCRCFKGPNRCLIGQHYYLTPDLRTVPLSRSLPLRIAARLSIPRIMPSNHANSLVICAQSAELIREIKCTLRGKKEWLRGRSRVVVSHWSITGHKNNCRTKDYKRLIWLY